MLSGAIGGMIPGMASKDRAERRKAQREEERRREEETQRALEEPRLPGFEKPATGRIVENPPRPRTPTKR